MSVTTSTTKEAPTMVPTFAQAQDDLPQRPIRTDNVRTSHRNAFGRIFLITPPVVLALLLLIGWYGSTTVGHVSSLFLPAPGDVLARLTDGLGAGTYLRDALAVTLQESTFGFLTGCRSRITTRVWNREVALFSHHYSAVLIGWSGSASTCGCPFPRFVVGVWFGAYHGHMYAGCAFPNGDKHNSWCADHRLRTD